MQKVAISILGTTMDNRGKGLKRWDQWRPTVAMCQQEDVIIDRMELLYEASYEGLAQKIRSDIHQVSPDTQVNFQRIAWENPWDFESVYSALLDFALAYDFHPEQEEYWVHITTGSHVAQICLYLLTEAGYLPGKLLQTSPKHPEGHPIGQVQLIDLDLSQYDQIASRFRQQHQTGAAYLKGGIDTRSESFNAMIAQLEKVSIRSKAPILLTGPTGAGKSQLAQRIYDLRFERGLVKGPLITVNCATLRGDNALSTLFGHTKGAFTGAEKARAGLLKSADSGVLFLDEIGELGLDEQTLLLRAIEEHRFMPLGADHEETSHFQLIAGTNRDLVSMAHEGSFRADLLARIDLWTYRLPSLSERLEDLAPNIDFELSRFSAREGYHATFNTQARQRYMRFGMSKEGLWPANFRDLNASITRMATLSDGGRINEAVVEEEIARLKRKWVPQLSNQSEDTAEALLLEASLSKDVLDTMDYYEQMQLAAVVKACRESPSMAAAGRLLFNRSRLNKSSSNDSHRVKQLLQKYGLSFADVSLTTDAI